MNFFRALKAGFELSNATAWKQLQQHSNAIATLLVFFAGLAKASGIQIDLSEDQAHQVVNGALALLTALGVFNLTATAVSTTRIDVLGRATPAPAGGDERAGDDLPAGSAEGRELAPSDNAGSGDPVPYMNDMNQRG